MPNLVKHPFRTPLVRRYLSDLFKPGHACNVSQSLGKQSRTSKATPPKKVPTKTNVTTTKGSLEPEPATATHLPNCIALETDDPSLDSDAIIITSLNTLPFCCHADLITMTRPQLVAVAQTLNDRLPNALKIDVDNAKPDAFIRNSIEILVGIHPRPTTAAVISPGAPRAERSFNSSVLLDGFISPGRSRRDLLLLEEPKSPVSPLASRSKVAKPDEEISFDFGSPTSKVLDVLEEEAEDEVREDDEDDSGTENIVERFNRPLKKKRRILDHKILFNTPPHLTRSTTLSRSQSHRTPGRNRQRHNALRSGTSTNLGRSRSLKAPERTLRDDRLVTELSRNVTITRGSSAKRARFQPHGPGNKDQEKPRFQFPSGIHTSTPLKRKRISSDSDIEMDNANDGTCIVAPPIASQPLGSTSSSPLPPITPHSSIAQTSFTMMSPILPSPYSAQCVADSQVIAKKLIFGTIDSEADETEDVTHELQEMRVSESDMDVSVESL